MSIWGQSYRKWLARGADHGDAAYRADRAEQRQRRTALAGKTAKQWADEYVVASGWKIGDDLGETEPAFAWLIAQAGDRA